MMVMSCKMCTFASRLLSGGGKPSPSQCVDSEILLAGNTVCESLKKVIKTISRKNKSRFKE